ncbi:Hypp3777 [Branchiostoma lanceolatum]|uniref:Hypp3777 protein n=1 Tax=Branchiostoma lanceolatum TaxID=7740 RepID=A0A8K0EYX5_BRALA|nr:Hypp3777 [Branchiostoma lanceolatum]
MSNDGPRKRRQQAGGGTHGRDPSLMWYQSSHEFFLVVLMVFTRQDVRTQSVFHQEAGLGGQDRGRDTRADGRRNDSDRHEVGESWKPSSFRLQAGLGALTAVMNGYGTGNGDHVTPPAARPRCVKRASQELMRRLVDLRRDPDSDRTDHQHPGHP